jgi:nitrogen-specific signal transduction histidine kinase
MKKSQREYIHDIRNALGGIAGYATFLEEDLKDQPKLQSMASRIVKGMNNLTELVNSMAEDIKSGEGNP